MVCLSKHFLLGTGFVFCRLLYFVHSDITEGGYFRFTDVRWLKLTNIIYSVERSTVSCHVQTCLYRGFVKQETGCIQRRVSSGVSWH